jgi:hypothetical protein
MNQNMVAMELPGVMQTFIGTGLMKSLCTFQKPTGAVGGTGAALNTYSNVPGLVDIPCMDAPPSPIRVTASETKAVTDVMAYEMRHVALNGWYPAVYSGWRGNDAEGTGPWQAVIDGIAFDILGVETDSQKTQTRLELKLSTI